MSLLAALALGTEGVSAIENRGKGKTNHNENRGSLLGRTAWAYKFLGPPSYFPLPKFLRRVRISHPHPFGKGRGDSGFVLAVVVGWVEDEQTSTVMRLMFY
jgi:hypothetical protein